MRKLILQMHVSVDGFVSGANGETDWVTPDQDGELKSYFNEIYKSVDCIIMGRKMAEGFIPHFISALANPETADAFAHKMVETPKIIFSRTLEKVEWENTELAKGDSLQEILQLKKESGENIIAFGGVSFASSLIRQSLVDEYNFLVHPVVLGKGIEIFNSLKVKLNLQLVKTKSFDCGAVLLAYKPK